MCVGFFCSDPIWPHASQPCSVYPVSGLLVVTNMWKIMQDKLIVLLLMKRK